MIWNQFSHLCLLTLLLIGCVAPAKHPALRDASLPDLIDRESFIIHPGQTAAHAVSPDGQRLAWLSFDRGNWTLFTSPIKGGQAVAIDTGCWCNVQWFEWASDSRHLYYATSIHGDGTSHLKLADSQHPYDASVNLTPEAHSLAILHHQLPHLPGQIIVTQNKRCRHCFDLYQIDVETGQAVPLDRSARDVLQWFTGHDGQLRGRIRVAADDMIRLEIRPKGSLEWRSLLALPTTEAVQVLGFTPDENGIWLLTNHGRDRIALIELEIASGRQRLLYEDPNVDLLSVFMGPRSRRPKAALSFPDYPNTHALDATVRQGLERFKIRPHQGIEILSMDATERIWTVRVFDERGSYYFLYYQASGEIVALGENRADPEDRWTASVKPVQFKSRDGLRINGYLTKPRGGTSSPAPMVLLVHGGPWSRDFWEYDDMVQFLANRGYTVLQINFRGSEGYGRHFKEAAIGEFAGKMHSDLLDAVDWAVAEGIADPAAIAIVGGSYGGYAAFVGLTQTPTVFACGIAINGVSDIGDYIDDLPTNPPPTLKLGIDAWHTYVAPPDAPQADRISERISPLYHVEKIQKPVLIIYGERDGRVAPKHSERMIAKLERLKKPVKTLKFMNEGHGIARINNTLEMFREMEAFLARHLGGRSAGLDKKAS